MSLPARVIELLERLVVAHERNAEAEERQAAALERIAERDAKPEKMAQAPKRGRVLDDEQIHRRAVAKLGRVGILPKR